MVDNKQRTTLKKLARWTPSSPSQSSGTRNVIPPLSNDAPFTNIHHDKLQQGTLYIIKIKQVSLAMFEGWNDDMCCFSILRSEVEPLRWSEARQLPGDFDVYNAFDESGNPPIHLWSRYLRVSVPSNWFNMFEEAKRKQREWMMHQNMIHEQQQQDQDYYYQQQKQLEGSNSNSSSNSSKNNNSSNNNNADIHNPDMPAYSNTDVSTMNLNNTNTNITAPTSPSIVASTNIIDPSLMNEDISDTPRLNHQISSSSVGTENQPAVEEYSNAHSPTANVIAHRRTLLSPTPSFQNSEGSSGIMDREQIRRHLAPGQAISSNRHSPSLVTLNSANLMTPPPTSGLVHHQSKEYFTHHDVANNSFSGDGESMKMESTISTEAVDFPHDSDRFSIKSDIVTRSPTVRSSVSTKTRNRSSMKKMIWG